MDRLPALRAFVEVADQRSFAKAARRLRISPTTASRGISDLETKLGAILLRRTTRSVGLTPEGAAYLERCRHILEDLDEADRSLRSERDTPLGSLRVTAPVVFGRQYILPIVTDLLRRHSRLSVQLTLDDRIAKVVEEGLDVAVRIAELTDSTLHAVHVGDARRVLVASPAYLDVHGEPMEVADLHAHKLIMFENTAPNMEWRFTAMGRPVIRGHSRLMTNHVETAIEAAIDGIGIARPLSFQVLEHIRAGRLKYLLEEFEPPRIPVNLVFQGNRRRTPNLRAFISSAQSYLQTRDLG